MGRTITKYRACTQKVLGGTRKLKPGQADAPHLNRVEKHHWSPSSIRYLGNFAQSKIHPSSHTRTKNGLP